MRIRNQLMSVVVASLAFACGAPGDPEIVEAEAEAIEGVLAKADFANPCAGLKGELETIGADLEQREREIDQTKRRLDELSAADDTSAAREAVALRQRYDALMAERERLLAAQAELGGAYEELLAEGACRREEPRPEPAPDAMGACILDGDHNGVLSLHEYEGAEPMPVADCQAAGGAVRGNLPRPQGEAAAADVSTQPAARPRNQRLRRLIRLLMRWIRGLGIHNRDYDAEDYDCDDFASDLEKALDDLFADLGTFTYIACDRDGDGTYEWAHAVTDVHIGGFIFWVEPQTGQITDLDYDRDGNVEYVTDFSSWPTATDGACFIAVFDDAEAAEDAGLELD